VSVDRAICWNSEVRKVRKREDARRTIIHHIMHTCFRENRHLPWRQYCMSVNRTILRAHMRLHAPLYHHHNVRRMGMDMGRKHHARSEVQLCNGLLLVHEYWPGSDVGVQDGAWFEGFSGLFCEVEDVLGVGGCVPEVEVGERHFQP
jgi:hypothetical protein